MGTRIPGWVVEDEKPRSGRGRRATSDADAALLARLRPPLDLGHAGDPFMDSADGVLLSGPNKGGGGPIVVPLFPSRPGVSAPAAVSLLTLDDGRLWVRGLLPALGWEPGPVVIQGLADRSVPLLVVWPGEPMRTRPFREVSRLDARGRIPLLRASRDVVGVDTAGQLLAWVRPLTSTAQDGRMGLALVAPSWVEPPRWPTDAEVAP